MSNLKKYEYMKINASLVGIDAVRTDIIQFASSLSFNGKKKVIILDEADGITAAAQAALRGAMNEYTDNTAFIFTANFRNKLIEPIISRLVEVNFLFNKEEYPVLAKELYSFIIKRLDDEGVEYDAKAVQSFLRNNLTNSTDIRKILIKAQKIANTGTFNQDSLLNGDESRLEELVQVVQSKNFTRIREWVGENSDLENPDIVRYLYDHIKEYVQPTKIPLIVEIINRHQYQHAFVIDKEINTVSMIAEICVSI